MERLNKYLASTGVASRRGADKLIEEGRVKVNGKVVKELGSSINEKNDTVMLDDKIVKAVSDYA
ncbi:MAG: pseudouridine synthase, partial [Clostridia bacterium]|nr:pseudouridine synthase [Clostridia bacterium]